MNNGHIPQPEYEQIITKMPIVCVDVAIYREGKILLIKRADEPARGEWWLPGGRLYKGEDLISCALRKASEETGLRCNVDEVIHFENTIFETGPSNIPIHSVNFCIRLWANGSRVVLDDTCLDYKWVADIDPNYHPYIKNCLRRALYYD